MLCFLRIIFKSVHNNRCRIDNSRNADGNDIDAESFLCQSAAVIADAGAGMDAGIADLDCAV